MKRIIFTLIVLTGILQSCESFVYAQDRPVFAQEPVLLRDGTLCYDYARHKTCQAIGLVLDTQQLTRLKETLLRQELREAWIDKLLILYDSYAAECWADSSYGYYMKFPSGSVEYNPNPNLTFQYPVNVVAKKEWVHRESTFEGFIKWLKKRK